MRSVIAALAVVLVIVGVSYACCGTCPIKATTVKEGEVINTTCPVMGGEVGKDSPYKTVYKGKTIGFCCAGCVEKFKEDPETYMAKIQKKCVIQCPKCGAEIDVMEQCKMQGICPAK